MPHSVIAELSITPIGSQSTSVSKQVSEAINAMKSIKGIKFQVNAMGTVLEAENLEEILEAVRVANEAIFSLGEKRVQTILKIDDRRDKTGTIESKLKSIKQYTGI